MTTLIIKNGRVIDPANNIDGNFDIKIENGKIAQIAASISATKADNIINAEGLIVSPGFVDVHVHLREPGQEYKETIETGTQAAAAGGFTSVCCMANTQPVNDHGAITEAILQRARETGSVNVFPIGAVTKNLDGKVLSEIGELREAGCVALSDDGRTLQNSAILRKALEYAKSFNMPLISHAMCPDLMGKGVMSEGFVSTELGLPGIPHIAEDIIIARDIAMAELTGCAVHVAHLATAKGVELVREGKKRGIPITCEVTPHHFTLTDEACRTYDTNTKMAPPLRRSEDIQAIKQGMRDGTVDAIATDHAPHAVSEKELDFEEAPFGIIGLETALALSLRLVDEKVIDLKRLVELLSTQPSKIMNLKKGNLSVGSDADITVFSSTEAWTYDVSQGYSKSKNTPFHGWKMKGRVKYTIVAGKVAYEEK